MIAPTPSPPQQGPMQPPQLPPVVQNPGAYWEHWIGGMNSGLPPWTDAGNQFALAENVMIRGGFPVTRPGKRVMASIMASNPQGACSFTVSGMSPFCVIAVDGKIYAAQAPFLEYAQISGLTFSPNAPIINFEPCIQGAKSNPDGTTTIITPKNILIIQDGVSAPGSWDGTTAKQLDPQASIPQTPIGLWMKWTSDRLWVANGPNVYVSNISDPTSFTENVYLAERSNFGLPGDCTGMLATSDQQTLLVFTQFTTTAFQSNNRNRTSWQNTPNFQYIVLPNTGCVSGRSCINQWNLSIWYSQQGLVSFNGAMYANRTGMVTALDFEMQRFKTNLAPDLSRIVVASVENLLLVSVPVGDKWNSQTWVMDQTPLEADAATTTMALYQGGLQQIWAGVWSGTRPVAWMQTTINGRQRQFFLSYDYTALNGTNIHTWEAFRNTRDDNGEPISCQFETGAIKEPIKINFRYAELDLIEIYGLVNLQVYVGGLAGPWRQILSTQLQAEIGSINDTDILTPTSILQNFKPQVRTVKTEQFSAQDKSVMPETKDVEGTDKCFQLLIQWQGQMGIRGIRMISDASTKHSERGHPHKSEATEENIVNEYGEVPA